MGKLKTKIKDWFLKYKELFNQAPKSFITGLVTGYILGKLI